MLRRMRVFYNEYRADTRYHGPHARHSVVLCTLPIYVYCVYLVSYCDFAVCVYCTEWIFLFSPDTEPEANGVAFDITILHTCTYVRTHTDTRRYKQLPTHTLVHTWIYLGPLRNKRTKEKCRFGISNFERIEGKSFDLFGNHNRKQTKKMESSIVLFLLNSICRILYSRRFDAGTLMRVL